VAYREKNLKKALDLLEEMKDENIQPNVYIYTSLINVCEKKRDLGTTHPPYSLRLLPLIVALC
jgi:pentatricopeptide repeat protein